MLVVCIAVVSCRKGEPYEIPCIEMYSGGENCDYIDTSLVSNYFLATLRGTHRFCHTDVIVERILRFLTPVNTPTMPGKDGVFGQTLVFLSIIEEPYEVWLELETPLYSPDVPLTKIIEDIEEISKFSGGYLPIGGKNSYDTYRLIITIDCIDEPSNFYRLSSNELDLSQRPARIDSLLKKYVYGTDTIRLGKHDIDEVSSFESDQHNRWMRVKRFKKVEHDDYYEYDIIFEFNLNLYMIHNTLRQLKSYGYYGPVEGVMRAHFGLKK